MGAPSGGCFFCLIKACRALKGQNQYRRFSRCKAGNAFGKYLGMVFNSHIPVIVIMVNFIPFSIVIKTICLQKKIKKRHLQQKSDFFDNLE